LLAILQQVGGKASNIQMMKWAFLLGKETPSYGGKTFYHFIPYHFGPYSFTLSQEVDKLVHSDLISKTESIDKKIWELTPAGREHLVNLPKQIFQDIATIVQQYGTLSGSDLIESVYARYPWFTVNSNFVEKRREQRPTASIAIYTGGYEGKTVDAFLNLLMLSGMRRVIDVRYNPISRRYGFHKSTLNRLCGYLEIDYQHLPELGVPGSARTELESADSYLALFKEYRCGLINRQTDLIKAVSFMKSAPSVLVCMEADPDYCHRKVLAQHLSSLTALPIQHLGYET